VAGIAVILLMRDRNAAWFAAVITLCFFLGGARGRAGEMRPADDYRGLLRTGREIYLLRGRFRGEAVRRGRGYLLDMKLSAFCAGGGWQSASGTAVVLAHFYPGHSSGREAVLKCRYSRFKHFSLDSGRDLRFLSGEKNGRSLRDRIGGLLNYKHTPAGKGIISAMVLGDKRGIPPLVKRTMLRTGTLHLLVVSGFNTGLVAFFALFLLKAARVPRKVRILRACCAVAAYCPATGSAPPVFRAAVMTILLLSAYLMRREAVLLNLLGCAAAVLLFCDPQMLFSVSFQLSFLSVFAIAVLCPLFRALFGNAAAGGRLLRWSREAGITGFSAWIGTLPFILFYFRLFSWVAVPANLLAAPLTSLITICGFCQIISVPFLPRLAGYFAFISDTLITVLVSLLVFLERFPGAWLKI
jgi:ComEC/Rec2-related protein